MNCCHQTLNDAKPVIDNLKETNYQYTIPNIGDWFELHKTSMISTLARGARQLVVQLALETMSMSDLYSFSLTPQTNMGASLLGAEMMTLLAPP